MNKSANVEKILGLFWDFVNDEFLFKVKLERIPADILSGYRKPTKREILRIVMSIYDPFGFVNYLTIVVKILLQEIWKSKYGWDQQVNNDHFKIWTDWQKQLQNLLKVKIPRRFIKINSPSTSTLHIFTDASEKAFCAVAYLRIENSASDVSVNFVMSKAKVTPISKTISIPRLELQAATLDVN